jgi:hypothetical protein
LAVSDSVVVVVAVSVVAVAVVRADVAAVRVPVTLAVVAVSVVTERVSMVSSAGSVKPVVTVRSSTDSEAIVPESAVIDTTSSAPVAAMVAVGFAASPKLTSPMSDDSPVTINVAAETAPLTSADARMALPVTETEAKVAAPRATGPVAAVTASLNVAAPVTERVPDTTTPVPVRLSMSAASKVAEVAVMEAAEMSPRLRSSDVQGKATAVAVMDEDTVSASTVALVAVSVSTVRAVMVVEGMTIDAKSMPLVSIVAAETVPDAVRSPTDAVVVTDAASKVPVVAETEELVSDVAVAVPREVVVAETETADTAPVTDALEAVSEPAEVITAVSEPLTSTVVAVTSLRVAVLVEVSKPVVTDPAVSAFVTVRESITASVSVMPVRLEVPVTFRAPTDSASAVRAVTWRARSSGTVSPGQRNMRPSSIATTVLNTISTNSSARSVRVPGESSNGAKPEKQPQPRPERAVYFLESDTGGRTGNTVGGNGGWGAGTGSVSMPTVTTSTGAEGGADGMVSGTGADTDSPSGGTKSRAKSSSAGV